MVRSPLILRNLLGSLHNDFGVDSMVTPIKSDATSVVNMTRTWAADKKHKHDIVRPFYNPQGVKNSKYSAIKKNMRSDTFRQPNFRNDKIRQLVVDASPDDAVTFLRSHPYSSVKSYNILIKELGDRGYLDQCEQVLNVMTDRGVPPTVVTYSTLISRAAAWQRVKLAESYFNRMIQSGVDADQFTFNSLINAYAKEGKTDKALSIIRLMDAKHVKPGVVTFNTIIDSCARSDFISVARSLEIFSAMVQRGINPNFRSYSSLIHVCCQAGDIDAAMKILGKMTREASISPSDVTYSTILHGLGKTGQIDRAFEFLDSIKQSGFKPNKVTMTSLIDACGKNGRLDMAFKLHAQMLSSDSPALRPNSITYSALIDSCLKNREVDKAFQLVQDMHKSKIEMTQVTYTSLLSELSRLRQLEKISQLKLWSHGREPEQQLRSPRQVLPFETREVKGTTNQVPLFLSTPLPLLISSSPDDIHQINQLIQSSSTVEKGEGNDSILSDDDEARYDAWFKQQAFRATAPSRWGESELPSPSPYSAVTRDSISSGTETESDGGSSRRSSDSISVASSGLTQRNQYFPSALEEYEAMKTSGKLPKADVYRALIRNIYTESTQKVMREKTGSGGSSSSSGNPTQAATASLPTVSYVQSTTDSSGAVPAASNTASGNTESVGGSSSSSSRKEKQKQLREDDLFRFFLVFKEMREAGIVPDTATYNTLINACAGAGDVQRALEVVEEMQSEGVAPDVITYTSLIKACGIQGGLGSVELAEDIFASMQQRTNHFSSYIAPTELTFQRLVQAHLRGASYSSYAAANSTSAAPATTAGGVSFSVLSDVVTDVGNDSGGSVVLDTQVHPAASSININATRIWELMDDLQRRNVQPGLFLCRACVRTALLCNDIDKALGLIEFIRESTRLRYDFKSWKDVADACAVKGRVEEERRLRKEISDKRSQFAVGEKITTTMTDPS